MSVDNVLSVKSSSSSDIEHSFSVSSSLDSDIRPRIKAAILVQSSITAPIYVLTYQIWNLLAHKAAENDIRVFFTMIDNGPNVPGGPIKDENAAYELREMNGDYPYGGKSPGILIIVNHNYKSIHEFETFEDETESKIIKKTIGRTISVSEDVIAGSQIKTIVAAKFICDNYNFEWLIRTNMSSFWNWNVLRAKLDTVAEKCLGINFIENSDGKIITDKSPETWPATVTGSYITFSGGFFSGAGMYFTQSAIKTVINRFFPGPLIEDVWFQSFYKDLNLLNFTNNNIAGLPANYLDFFNASDETAEYNPDLISTTEIALVHHYRVRGSDNSHDGRVKHDIPYFKQLVKQIYGFDLHME